MRAITALAPMVERGRKSLPPTDPFRAAEREAIERISKIIEKAREQRDAIEEKVFELAYGSTMGKPADGAENGARVEVRKIGCNGSHDCMKVLYKLKNTLGKNDLFYLE